MASAFGHAAVALALGTAFGPPDRPMPRSAWLLAVGCAVLPDADVVGFALGIPYEHLLGHRGLSHSGLVAVLIGTLAAQLVPRASWPRGRWRLAAWLTLATLSHGVLDAMTTGGHGVAFFAPFSDARHFLPWRPILVSPVSPARFLGERGIAVLRSELLWVGLPSLAFAMGATAWRRARDVRATSRTST